MAARHRAPLRLPLSLAAALLTASLGAASLGVGNNLPLGTTLNDFFEPGTQPNTLNDSLFESIACFGCHAGYDVEQEPYTKWAASMMGQASRDPVFHACLAIAEQDAQFVGDVCIRCHAPIGWVGGRSTPTDGSGLDPNLGDFDGVSCHVCHRMVDPVFDAAENPAEDAGVLAMLPDPPSGAPHSGQFVLDHLDRRRGPFDLGGFSLHDWRQSPYHREALMCANCHDVSNPAFDKQLDGTYKLNATDAPHPTHDKRDQFPLERTFSEWEASAFAVTALDMGGRFGGNQPEVATCQDCHMPTTEGIGCRPNFNPPTRPDLPMHEFNGGNSWVLRAVRNLYDDLTTGLTQQSVDDSIERARRMVQSAADLYVFTRGGELVVRVVNQSGHKLPTGYPEGRRMWLNVVFRDAGGTLLAEHGAYDFGTADLTTADTTVFEAKLGLDAYMAGVTGLPAGESFHFALNNTYVKDNRIPPRGFTNAGFETAQAAPVGATYLEEQYWSDSTFTVPPGAVKATARLYYQTTSKEYIEFLRDENEDPSPNDVGQVAYDQWLATGMSEPVLAARMSVRVGNPPCPQPIPYGLGKVNSLGDRSELGWGGVPSFASNNFRLKLDKVVANQPGALFASAAPDSVPFGGGTRLLAAPQTQVATFVTSGFGAYVVPIPITAGMIDTEVYYQAWYRDPSDPSGFGLTNGVHVDFCD